MSNRRPNILFIMVDEMRYPPSYETKEIKIWRKKYLHAQNRLKREGIEFINHYTGSTACAPARTTLFTGEYPTVHGVSQTDGAAKSAFDADMFWLDPNTVPVMGEYFQLAGYDTYYKGKWHISRDSDIVLPGTTNSLASYNLNGTVNEKNTNIYLHAERLKEFGFQGIIGPEPQGLNPLNSGSSSQNPINGRDIVYVDQVINNLKSYSESDQKKPFLLVASLVNPHDITLYGELTNKLPVFNFSIDPSVPPIPRAPNAEDDLSTKPICQEEYRIKYQQGFQPTIDTEEYRRLYYSLNLTADRNVNRILDALDNYDLTDNTVIVFTSDHGDYLGSHNLFQKWFTAYQEAIHVPLIIKLPDTFRRENKISKTLTRGIKKDNLTSHLDIMPTLLNLINAPIEKIQCQLKKSHTEVHPFVGRNLVPLLYGKGLSDEPICFMTNDNVLKGENQVTVTGQPYLTVGQPSNIQTVITKITNKNHLTETWKYSRYFDDPDFWSQPDVQDTVIVSDTLYTLPNGPQKQNIVS